MQYFEADPKARTEKRKEQSSGATVRADCSPCLWHWPETSRRAKEQGKDTECFPKIISSL